MSESYRKVLGAAIAAPALGAMMLGSAEAAQDVCDWRTARNIASSGNYAALCDCTHVTPSFIKRLQNRADFSDTLQATSAQCPGLTELLTDLPTANLTNAQAAGTGGENRDSDRDDVELSANGETGDGQYVGNSGGESFGEGNGAGPSDGGANSGGNSENDGENDVGGSNEPGNDDDGTGETGDGTDNGNDGPSIGNDGPSKGKDGPGQGKDGPGKGKDSPGKGAGKGGNGDKGGKGKK
ncbi:hypothetical protein [Ruegeria arenilitoris]|uniref:hypothetical protein n=1 Tax=Ruegeria arenilitoris TaxID=1173585 RepID=UPI00147E6120|nr:hypothetical protein [Ruegeria arenilitoris]